MPSAATTHMSAKSYNQSGSVQHMVTKDEVHPTDQMYKLIWLEIREQIRKSNCTFGNLNPVGAATPLSTVQSFGEVMDEIGATPQARLTPTGHTLW